MPYINEHKRREIDLYGEHTVEGPGDLNYLLTSTCLRYLGDKVSYSKINEIIGVLECVKLEFYRRLASPYEDKKIMENGDIDGYKSGEACSGRSRSADDVGSW